MTDLNSILIVGCGNMAGAMLQGWIAAGLEPERFVVMNPSPRELPAGVKQLHSLPESGSFDAVMLGYKPQKLAEIAPTMEHLAGPETAILSILAGVTLDTLEGYFPRAKVCVRVMPNLAVALGKSPIGLVAGDIPSDLQDAIGKVMNMLGTAEWLPEEGDMDLVTALAGSGPAYVYRFIDALATGATELGLPREQADRLALAMVEGAAALAASSDYSPGELARRVASPGGTTQAGIDTLDADNALANLMHKTLKSARDRSVEMAAEARAKG